MKTTSYEISKKLAEIGFFAFYDYFYWSASKYRDQDTLNLDINYDDSKHREDKIIYPAYDLETILETLPDNPYKGTYKTERKFFLEKEYIGYQFYEGISDQIECDKTFYCHKEKDESLVDTAARLLLKLVEAGIVKFNN